jgi:hypothetical protein
MLLVEVAEENAPDGRVLQHLVQNASSKAQLVGAIGEGVYDFRSNLGYLRDKGVEPVNRVRKNSSLKAMG